MKTRYPVIIFVLNLLTIDLLYSQTELTFTSSKDNTLIEPQPSDEIASNGIGPNFFVGRTTPNAGNTLRRGVIAFDLTSIPSVAVVQNVTLTLNMSMTNPGVTTVHLHRLLADWGEGGSFSTGGAGADAESGDATWFHRFFDTDFWTSQGGDFVSTESANQQIGNNGFYTWGPTAQMIADVQEWVNNAAQNFGWILIGEEEVPMSAKRFDTHEHMNVNVRPVLTVTFLPTAVDDDRENLPTWFRLAQNFPNPFNPNTVIHYTLPQNTLATLEIFNIVGEKVRTLVNARNSAGTNTAQWDGRNDSGEILPSGVYLYRLLAGTSIQIRKMLLVR